MVAEVDSENMDRGLITDGERAVVRGEKEDASKSYEYNIRHRIRSRMDLIRHDVELLEEHGYEDLASEFRDMYDPMKQLENRVEELEEKCEDSDTS